MSRARAALLVAVAACSGSSDAPRTEPAAAPVADAGADAISTRAVPDPGTTSPTRPGPKRPGRAIEIILRSNPPGAQVAVDGTPYGATPQVWSGETGAEHEFTFTLGGHAMARYRFIPITTGILHARLEPVAEDVDAGVAAPPEVLSPAHPEIPPTAEIVDAQPAPLAAPPDAFAPAALAPDATAPGLGPPF